jgi:hypothetical protein
MSESGFVTKTRARNRGKVVLVFHFSNKNKLVTLHIHMTKKVQFLSFCLMFLDLGNPISCSSKLGLKRFLPQHETTFYLQQLSEEMSHLAVSNFVCYLNSIQKFKTKKQKAVSHGRGNNILSTHFQPLKFVALDLCVFELEDKFQKIERYNYQ